MSVSDDAIHTYEVREVVASFHDADMFEAAVQALQDRKIKRDAINMMASHDAVRKKLNQHFKETMDVSQADDLPQPIYEDRHEIEADKRLAVGMPVYVGGAGAGLAVVATGGTLAFAALIAAAGAAVGAGIGALIAHAIGEHHANLLAKQLKKGALLVLVEVTDEQEEMVVDILENAGGEDVTAHTLTRYEIFDRTALPVFDPYGWPAF